MVTYNKPDNIGKGVVDITGQFDPKKLSKVTDSEIAVTSHYEFYTIYFRRLMSIVMSRFTWGNLPEYIPDDIPERILIYNGTGVLFKDKNVGVQLLPAVQTGALDIYGRPTELQPITMAGMNISSYFQNGGEAKRVNVGNSIKLGKDGVMLWANMDGMNDLYTINYYANQMAHLRVIQMANLNHQMTTQIILADEKTRLSMENISRQRKVGAATIITSKNVDPNTIFNYSALPPYIADKIEDQLVNVWSEALTTFGVNTAAAEKRERLIVDEVNANNQEVAQGLSMPLKYREMGVDRFNKMFGENITVERHIPDAKALLDPMGSKVDSNATVPTTPTKQV